MNYGTMRPVCFKAVFMVVYYIALLPFMATYMREMGLVMGCHEPEREALLDMKRSVVSDPANRLSSWKGPDCCRWEGVTCHNVSRHVLHLHLRNDLSSCHNYDLDHNKTKCDIAENVVIKFANLSLSLVELKQLRKLDLSGNDFNGSRIPGSISSMRKLGYLNLSNAGFGGNIPPQLGNLTRLQALDLKDNCFGAANNYQWLSSLVNLKYLDLSTYEYDMSILDDLTINKSTWGFYSLMDDLTADMMSTTSASHSLMDALMALPCLLDLRLRGTLRYASGPPGSRILLNSTFIQHLDLSGNLFKGPIPEILSNISSLKFLDLSDNTFKGPLPHSLFDLWSLNFFSISCNSFDGLLPNSLFNMSTLKYLDLSENSFEGSLPYSSSNVSSLKFLDLSLNSFKGVVPLWLKNIRGLEVLDLGRNLFSHVEGGSIMGILKNLCNLHLLDFSDNQLRGDILSLHDSYNSSICISYKLKILDLSFNYITSTLPYWFGDLKKLEGLALGGGNTFEGPIPEFIGNLSLLEYLDLSNCSVKGSIPSSIGKLSSLERLDLSSNFLEGYILDSHFSNLSSLIQLDLSLNHLSGSIPSSIGYLSSLDTLDLSSNYLHGSVSESHFRNLFNLLTLDLSFNPLNLNLSSNWLPKFQLIEFRMRSCKIKGLFPQWIKSQLELITLDLSDNNIHGELPRWFPSPNLNEMNLSRNQIVGFIPHFSSSQVSSIDLSYNSLSGSLLHNKYAMNGQVPNNSLCGLKYLNFLDLQRNQLSGTIPDCWGISERLNVMDLSSNRLSGRIPMSIGLLPSLVYLKLNNNSLRGGIPSSLNIQGQMMILDLGENKLSGKVPNWGTNTHPFLTVLRLRANQLTGVIPPRLCTLPHLQLLDLAQNNLTGNIPNCFSNFKGMKSSYHANGPISEPVVIEAAPPKSSEEEYAMVVLKGAERQYTTNLRFVVDLDLSCNNLVGSIPEELVQLDHLNCLNLSYNHLTGRIPDKIGAMKSLESLDLSNNFLSGTIPLSLSEITSLSSLNLSCNKLHGQIPSGNQLQTLNDPSMYANNEGLCGDPLPPCRSTNGRGHEQEEEEDEGESKFEKVLFILVVMLGFATGFWGVVGSLLLNKAWRHAFFRRVEKMTDFLYVHVVVSIKRSKN